MKSDELQKIKDALLIVTEMQLKKKVITEEEYVKLLNKLKKTLESCLE
jgi:hypothetical protein